MSKQMLWPIILFLPTYCIGCIWYFLKMDRWIWDYKKICHSFLVKIPFSCFIIRKCLWYNIFSFLTSSECCIFLTTWFETFSQRFKYHFLIVKIFCTFTHFLQQEHCYNCVFHRELNACLTQNFYHIKESSLSSHEYWCSTSQCLIVMW